MNEADLKHAEIIFDSEGYLDDVHSWNPNMAIQLAEAAGISHLTEKHWNIINYLRKNFIDKNEIPTIPKLAEEKGITVKEFYSLFPKGPLKTSAKIAGIKKPKSCI